MNYPFPKVCAALIKGTASLLAFPALCIAMPTVSGNILTWQDAGWYQVQRADNFETVCEGNLSGSSAIAGGPCVIDAGNYIVINHSTGERFENITAGSDNPNNTQNNTPSFSPVNTVIVDNNQIRWPDNGWYQVQDATSFATACEGGTSCAVQPGTYVVINHTTGMRYENIEVTAQDVINSETGGVTVEPISIEVTGNTIRWPDDGWYQVQNEVDYLSACEGGSSCTVEPGEYVVINHSTGERYSNIVVSGSTAASPLLSVRLEDNSIRMPDDGWYQVQDATSYETVCEGGSSCDVTPGQYFVINHTSGERTVIDVPPANGAGASEIGLTTRIFSITVPAYVSNALQVRVEYGDAGVNASWVADETWTATVMVPTNTENQLVVTFSDRNGGIALGTYELTETFRDLDTPVTYVIQGSQFDTDRWDTDGDGFSNLEELRAGDDPLVGSSVSLEIRDSLNSGDQRYLTYLFSRASAYFESSMPDERPYFEDLEEVDPQPEFWDGSNWDQRRQSTINIDAAGNGTLNRSARSQFVFGDYNRLTEEGARTHSEGSIRWTGWHQVFNGGAGCPLSDVRFDTQTTRAAADVVMQEGEQRHSVRCSGNEAVDFTYSLTGVEMDESDFCEATAGSITIHPFYTSTSTISKTPEGTYWHVYREDREGQFIEEYLVPTIDLEFYCQHQDL